MTPRTSLLFLAAAALACGGAVAPEAAPDAGPPRCGDGIRQGTEECDRGELNGPGSGCEKDCTLTCIPGDALRGDAHCDPHDLCKGRGVCTADRACALRDPLPSGASCGAGHICRAGACAEPVCGDGIVTAPEECDDGKNDGSAGCGADCRFTCVSGDAARSCAPTNPCQGPATCQGASHTCTARSSAADGTACGTALICRAGACVSAGCGNGVVEAGEDCEPPGTATCDASCKRIAVCGNGEREGSEQCDDGNTTNLDGCDSSCRFEQVVRANSVTMHFGTDTFCTVNALGGAIGGSAQSQVQNQINAGVAGGTMSMAFALLGLQDLSGTNATALKLGAVTGAPAAAPPGKTYDGTQDLDWWYTARPDQLTADRKPTAQLDGGITAKQLHAGPGRMEISLSLGAGPVQLAGSGVRIKGSVGGTSVPTASARGTPGHTPVEHLDPALTSFSAIANGELCGNVSAFSLAQVPAPLSVQSGGSTACGEGYGAANTMLDVIVGGCHVFGGLITAVAPTQPDQSDPGVPAAGAGPRYTLGLTGTSVTSCTDKNGATVSLAACLKAAAYSASLGFGAGRVILK